MSNEIQKANPETGIVMPAVSAKQAIAAWKEYEELKKAIVDPEKDIQVIGKEKFLKKSYWRKAATFFNLTVEVIKEEKEILGKTVVWHFTVKAIAPTGRFAIGTGSCDAYEKAKLIDGKYVAKGKVSKWGKTSDGKSYPLEFEWVPATPNTIHNIRATAETRATNRAISNLIGGGEVSAEEIEQETLSLASQPTPDPKIDPTQTKKIMALGKALGKSAKDTRDVVLSYLKVNSFDDITKSQADRFIAAMEKKAAMNESVDPDEADKAIGKEDES